MGMLRAKETTIDRHHKVEAGQVELHFSISSTCSNKEPSARARRTSHQQKNQPASSKFNRWSQKVSPDAYVLHCLVVSNIWMICDFIYGMSSFHILPSKVHHFWWWNFTSSRLSHDSQGVHRDNASGYCRNSVINIGSLAKKEILRGDTDLIWSNNVLTLRLQLAELRFMLDMNRELKANKTIYITPSHLW